MLFSDAPLRLLSASPNNRTHSLFLVDIHHEGLAAVRLFHVFDVGMLVFGGAAFLKHFHDQLGDDIAGSARTHADEDSSKQRQVKLLALSRNYASLADVACFGSLVPGGGKIGRADAKVR